MSVELVTMRDIAVLARVARPAVTTWRRRFRTGSSPFPAPAMHRDDQELFSRDEVVTWLEETEHGNNLDARAESRAVAVLSDPRLSEAPNFDCFSALLVLRSLLDVPLTGLDREDLLDAADTLDPDHTFIFREVECVTNPTWLVAAAESLVETSWSVADAHQRLLRAQLPVMRARVLLGSAGNRLLQVISAPLLRELGAQAGLLDPTGCRFDVIPELAKITEARVAVLDGDSRSHRLHRRVLRLAGVVPTVINAEGGWSATGPTLSVAVLPELAHPAADEVSQLGLVDDVALQLTSDQALVVLAPAALLTDPLDGQPGTQRDQLLRSGVVRSIVRLPAGFMPGRSRESMGLWLVTAPDGTAPADRRTLVADLSRRDLTPSRMEGLAMDLLAAWQGPEGARRRAWAHLHPVHTSGLLAADASLVPAAPVRHHDASEAAGVTGSDWVVRLQGRAARHLPDFAFAIENGTPERLSLLQSAQRGWLRMIPGRRFAIDSLDSSSTGAGVPVWDAAAVTNLTEQREVDRLALHGVVDPLFTEPGDVVFVNRPRPVAVVDRLGGAAVCAPARIVRARPGSPLVPDAIALRINAETSSDWRAWTFATVLEPQTLRVAHAELTAQRDRLVSELAELDRFTHDLTTAAESRQLTLTLKEHHGQADS